MTIIWIPAPTIDSPAWADPTPARTACSEPPPQPGVIRVKRPPAFIIRRAPGGHASQVPAQQGDALRDAYAQAIAHLKRPMLGNAEARLAADSTVMDALVSHAERRGIPLGRQQLAELVTVGEHLAGLLRCTDRDDGKVQIVGDHPLRCNGYMARAIAWYLAAAAVKNAHAAGKQLALPSSNAFVVADPGARLYRFLRGAFGAYPRPSTHFAAESAESKYRWFGCIPTGQAGQWGIECMRGLFPCKRGSMLFGKLHGDTPGSTCLMLKLEEAGLPPLLYRGKAGTCFRAAYFFRALERNLRHAVLYLRSRFARRSGHDCFDRLEHLHKGTLRAAVWEPYQALLSSVREAQRRGKVQRDAPMPSAKPRTLDTVSGHVAAIAEWANAEMARLCDTVMTASRNESLGSLEAVAEQARLLSARIAAARAEMEPPLQSFERRNSEIHVGVPADTQLWHSIDSPYHPRAKSRPRGG